MLRMSLASAWLVVADSHERPVKPDTRLLQSGIQVGSKCGGSNKQEYLANGKPKRRARHPNAVTGPPAEWKTVEMDLQYQKKIWNWN